MADVKTNILLGAGAIALTQTLSLWGGEIAPAAKAATPGLLFVTEDDSGGEGGEGGGEGGGGVPSSYALGSTDPTKWAYDAKPVIDAYVEGVSKQYALALGDARKMSAAIDALLAQPSQATLEAARAAWAAARPAYLRTEAFRFYDGPIEEIESRINSWPMNEAFIDYTRDDPKSGLINDPGFTIEAAAIAARNQVSDEADVTTGWHAIEFLLWGQDFNAEGPGDRPFTDYTPGAPANDKRRAYLKAVTDLLVDDLAGVAKAWDLSDPNSYGASLRAMPQREAVGRMLNGIAVLAGSEFRSERMAVALDSGDQEDEQSCFSDTTHQDFVHDMAGIEDVYYGRAGGAPGASLSDLVKTLDAAQAQKIDAAMADARAKVAALGDPWDQVLAAAPDSKARQDAEAAVEALGALALELKAAGKTLGVLVQVPGI